jgi:hypothetical protein
MLSGWRPGHCGGDQVELFAERGISVDHVTI